MRTSEAHGNGGWARRALGPLVVAALAAAVAPAASAMETTARQAFMFDSGTGTVLFEKNADQLMPPSSMSKLMTVYMVFERLRKGTLSLSDTFRVSENAWRKGGAKSGSSTMFLEPGQVVKVEDLLRGVIVQSGNDACIVLAEGLASSEAAFAAQATARARELGLAHTVFRNATGWPDPEHVTTARELALLAKRTIEDFPDFYHLYSEKIFEYNGKKQPNRNPLLYRNIGVDGLKTGHTEDAGFGLTASMKRNERRLVLVVNGLSTMKERGQETERLLEWGMREFENYALFKAGDVVTSADVWLGVEATVPLQVADNVLVTLPRVARPRMVVKAVYDGPLATPIQKGQRVATLVVTAPDVPEIAVPLLAGAEVERLGLFGRLGAALKHILFGAAAS